MAVLTCSTRYLQLRDQRLAGSSSSAASAADPTSRLASGGEENIVERRESEEKGSEAGSAEGVQELPAAARKDEEVAVM